MIASIHFPPELPISQRKDEIVSAIQAHQVIILSGETGSGKTTQIPKMCLEAGLGAKRKIACTQPRRVAALSVAKRVAEELKVEFGSEVGAKIRFTDKTSRKTRIKFMTDGMLLSEIHGDPLMRKYDCVIVDEAHERSLNIDFLLGHLNQIRQQRPDLKIVITSATIDTEKFSKAFDKAPILEVSGRVYPVELIHAPLDELLEDSGEFTYIEGIAESVDRIQKEMGLGDILVFLPTEKDIREAMELLQGRFGRRTEIIPCFGRLSNADQQRIFLPTARRKLVLATNIAETSLTIPGIRFVIDTGLARISRYNPRGRTRRLPIVKVSQSSANQRKGRCGRVEDGICIRLYSEKDFDSRPVYTVPEIQRANLADVILRMKAADLGDIETFPFIDPPSAAAITSGYALLEELGALEKDRKITALGRKLSKLPIDPTVGRMLLEAESEGVIEEVLVIASALSIQDPRERPLDKEATARQAHSQFNHSDSDFLSLLNIWEALHEEFERLSQGKLRRFCRTHFLNYLRMREWRDIYDQLKRSMREFEASARRLRKPPKDPSLETPAPLTRDSPRYQAIHTCLLTGLLANIGRREETNLYRFAANRKPLIFPGSALFVKQPFDKRGKRKDPGTEAGPKKKSPEWILSGEIVETNRLYARTAAAIDPAWISKVGNHVVKRSYSDPQFLLKEGRVIARESVRIHGLEIQNRKVSYLKIDPQQATEIFIREALLNEDFETPSNWNFLESNRQLIRRIQNAQTVVSIAHWKGVDEAAFQFYRKRLERIASLHDLNRYLRRASSESKCPLAMVESDLLVSEEASLDLSLFPTSVELDNSALPIEYHYDPGNEKDGVTLKLPYAKSGSLSNAMLDWLVPGHLEAKVFALLKALPKRIRQTLHPLAETARTISSELRPTGKTLIESLSNYLESKYSIETYASDWDETAVPDHLQTRVEIYDGKGEQVAHGRNMETIRSRLSERESELSRRQAPDSSDIWKKARSRFEREIGSATELGQLIENWPLNRDGNNASHSLCIQIGDQSGIPIYAYPALRAPITQFDTRGAPLQRLPTIHLFKSESEARVANQEGIASLIEHELRRELAWIRSDLKEVERLGPVAVSFRSLHDLKEDVYEHIRQSLRTHSLATLKADAVSQQVEVSRSLSKGLLYQVVDQLQTVLEKRQALIVKPEIQKGFGAEIERLLPPDFLRHTPNWALARIPIYLECLSKRIATRLTNPDRDAQRAKRVQAYRTRLAELDAKKRLPNLFQASPASNLKFALEEFAVSVFAQELGTAFPISAKKLTQLFDQTAKSETPMQQPAKRARKDRTAHSQQARAKAPDRPTKSDLESLKKLFK